MTDYDMITNGVKVAIVGGDDGLGADIVANTAALGTLTTAVNALKASVDLLKTAVDADTAAD